MGCITTVVVIPVLSPNVGHIIIALYSRYERARDEALLL